ncbi:MAG: ribosome maturation factor RimM [Hyphomicrobiaceae bacterium]|nr:ribosome maturation factor RimM [Hyphomicrobiaceae bacterium]
MTSNPRVLLGVVTGAHGIRGEVTIKSFTAVAEDIAAYGPLTDGGGGRPLRLKVKRVTTKGVVAAVAGVTDRTAAEALRGAELWVARDRLPPTEDGEFYHADLIGMAAVDKAGQPFGEVVGVENYGAGDLLEVRLAGGRKTELVPFTLAHVPDVDVAGRRVIVAWPLAYVVAQGFEPDAHDEGGTDDGCEATVK